MFLSSERLERGWKVLMRIITFLLEPFERKKKMCTFFIYGNKIFCLIKYFDLEDFDESLLLEEIY